MSKYYYGMSRIITEHQKASFWGGYFVRQLYVSPEFKVRLILSACGLSNLTKTYSSWFLLCFPSSALSPSLCLWAELYFTSQKQKTKKEWGGVGDGVDIFILRAEVVIFLGCLFVSFIFVRFITAPFYSPLTTVLISDVKQRQKLARQG